MVVKPILGTRRILLYVWWDRLGIVYYKLIPHRQILNLHLYSQQLSHLKEAIAPKRSALSNMRYEKNWVPSIQGHTHR